MSTSGNERRGFRRKLIAALSTGTLAVAGGVAPHAHAYVVKDDSFLNGNPDNKNQELQPKVSVNVTPTDKEVEPGETVELEFTGSFEAPFPPSGNQLGPGESDVKGATIALQFSDQLEAEPQIDPSAFVWKSGEKRNAEVKPAGGGYIVDFGYISANDSFTYKVPVKVSEDIEPGTEFSPATIEATARIAPENQFPGRNDADFTQDPNDRCTLISKSSYVSDNLSLIHI